MRHCLLAFGLWLMVALVSCAPTEPASMGASSLDSLVAQHATQLLADQRFHSVSIGILQDGLPSTFHYGEMVEGEGLSPADSSLYEIASVTKTFTGTLAAQAVLDGHIRLDDDIRDYLDGPYPNLAFGGSPITIQHLLTHTSGFPNFPPQGDDKASFLEGLHQIEIDTEPGTFFQYSNTAPELTAYILESVYQAPYEELVERFILKPAGMTSTKFVLEQTDSLRLIQGFNDAGEAMPHFERTLWGGISGLHATIPDLLRYAAFHLDESQPMVKESHREFFTTRWDFSVGYHWNIVHNEDGLILRHHGGIYGMQNWLMIFPEDEMALSIATNVSFEETGEILDEVALDLWQDLRNN